MPRIIDLFVGYLNVTLYGSSNPNRMVWLPSRFLVTFSVLPYFPVFVPQKNRPQIALRQNLQVFLNKIAGKKQGFRGFQPKCVFPSTDSIVIWVCFKYL